MPTPIIALLTDFGTTEPYAGIVKGVIAGIAPAAALVDLTHDIPAGDIRRAAFMLWQSAQFFPPGTIFLAVVDPGVGTSRRPVIVETDPEHPENGQRLIGPDNGLFTFLLSDHFKAFELANPAFRLPRPSATFHGRDIFAPAAAYAARGARGPEFGPVVQDPVRLPFPRLEEAGPGIISGEILFADRFGNYLTSLGIFEPQNEEILLFQPWVGNMGQRTFPVRQLSLILPSGERLSLVKTFDQIPPEKTAVMVGSSGLLEIAANRRSAADLLKLGEGELVVLEIKIKGAST